MSKTIKQLTGAIFPLNDETRLFLSSTLLIFIIRCSGLVFNNFTETAFLKRFGVEFLPIIYIVNPIITLVLIARFSSLMDRRTGYQILSKLLVFSGLAGGVFWLLVSLELKMIYPFMFVMKAQIEILLGIVFWNLANDLFNLHQSKRLFPLITAGGVAGDVCGSFFTPLLANAWNINHLLIVYAMMTLAGAYMVKQMKGSFPSGLLLNNRKKKSATLVNQYKNFRHVMQHSRLILILVFLTFFSNIVLPFMNYQFNFAVDSYFSTEAGMVAFFGYFRGIMNIFSFALLFYSGRFYAKFGLPGALMVHPLNYLLIFVAFFFKVDLVSAIYARFSSNVVRTTLNRPVNNIVIGIFPENIRAAIRPFLRGVVARAGLVSGALILFVAEKWVEPASLSIVAIPFVTGWILSALYLKKNYSKILSKMFSMNMIDLKSMEKDVVARLFKDSSLESELVHRFRHGNRAELLSYVKIMKFFSIPQLDDHILYVMEKQGAETAKQLMPYLSGTAGEKAFTVFRKMVDIDDKELMVSMIHGVKLIKSQACVDFFEDILRRCRDKKSGVCHYPEVRGYASACLALKKPQEYRQRITRWITSTESSDLQSGIIALGEIGDPSSIGTVKSLLEENPNNAMTVFLIEALYKLGPADMNTIALGFLSHPLRSCRMAALQGLSIENDTHLRAVVEMLSETDGNVQRLAAQKIKTSRYQNPLVLFASLNKPCSLSRERIFDLIDEMDIKEIDLFHYFRQQLSMCYVYLTINTRLTEMKRTPATKLLMTHLEQRKNEYIKTVLRIFTMADKTGQMKPVFRMFYSNEPRQHFNALEAIESRLEPALRQLLMPLVDESREWSVIEEGKRWFSLPDFGKDANQICSYLMDAENPVTVLLALATALEKKLDRISPDKLKKLRTSDSREIQNLARRLETTCFEEGVKEMDNALSLYEKIAHIEKVNIFKGLAINELAAIAEITEEKSYPKDYQLCTEGSAAETMYIALSGKILASRGNTEMGRFSAGDSFGLTALLLDDKRLLSCVTEEKSSFLVIHKREFEEMLLEYPRISYEFARIQSRRVEKLLGNIGKQDKAFSDVFGSDRADG
ncbi:MAG: Npt1/Npt2 family nucleotide transporter [Desulfobacteraceae bacterium]